MLSGIEIFKFFVCDHLKVEQLNFLSENLKEIFPPQLPGRRYVTESSLCRVALGEVAVTSVTESQRVTATNMAAMTYAGALGRSGCEDILLKIIKLCLQNDAEANININPDNLLYCGSRR